MRYLVLRVGWSAIGTAQVQAQSPSPPGQVRVDDVQKSSRPLSHDVMHATWQAHGVKVVQVRISLEEEIYHGELTMAGAGRTRVCDCRAPDGIAWAIHCGAPIFVEE